ncbi:hypothetical protein OGATHE_005783 [Ogataea polymorpha]|uniref:Uncharacterized protein n=1 Tax=Ogataea polymorpha TaxID=460523 RepID=A0A9P8NST8_9ASCO|nr:hypothetical protein OGATHE_005783 [Ogataea polymorpha]
MVELDQLVQRKSQGEQIEHHLDGSQMGGDGVCVDNKGEKRQIQDRKGDFQNVLVQWGFDSIRVKVLEEVCVSCSLEQDVIGGICRRLDDPAPPYPFQTSLVAA